MACSSESFIIADFIKGVMMSRNEAQGLVDKMNLVLKTTPFPKAVMLDEYDRLMRTLRGEGWNTKVVNLTFLRGQINATLCLAEREVR